MHESNSENFKKYREYVNNVLIEKENYPHYKYLNGCIKIFESYCSEIKKINNKQSFNSKAKTRVFKILFNVSLSYFNELRNSIITSNFTSSYCMLRIIVENYILMSFLAKKDFTFAKKYNSFSNVILYNRIEENPSDNKFIDNKTRIKIKAAYKKTKFQIEKDFSSLSKTQQQNFGCKPEQLLKRNHFGWLSTYFLKEPKLYLIANEIGLIDDNNNWAQLSFFVHSNEMIIKYQQLKPEIENEMRIVKKYYEYITKYINLYIEIIKMPKAEIIKLEKKMQTIVDEANNQLEECYGIVLKAKN